MDVGDVFGTDSDSDTETKAAPGKKNCEACVRAVASEKRTLASHATAGTQPPVTIAVNEQDIFGSDSDSDDASDEDYGAKTAPKRRRLNKGSQKKKKKKKKKVSVRGVLRGVVRGVVSRVLRVCTPVGFAALWSQESAEDGEKKHNAYGAEDEVRQNADDKAFLASDDDDDLAAAYSYKQEFNDEIDHDFEQGEQGGGRGRGQRRAASGQGARRQPKRRGGSKISKEDGEKKAEVICLIFFLRRDMWW